MSRNGAQLGRLLGASESLSRLQEHATRLLRLQRLLDASLPEQLRGHCRVANFQAGNLSLHASSAVLAGRLKLEAPRLRAELIAAGEQVSDVQVRVRPPSTFAPPKTQPSVRKLGQPGRAALDALKSRLAPDSPLGLALQRMLDNLE